MWRLTRHYRIELTWLMLLLLFALMAPKKAFASDVGHLVMESDACEDEPIDCYVEI